MYDLIKEQEGFRRHAYKCAAGVWTIGYGTTIYPDGTRVKQGDTISIEKAEEYLRHYCETQIQLPEGDFNDKQKEALCSLIYNIGQPAFNRSSVKKAIEEGRTQDIEKHWKAWNKAGGRILAGLVERRNKEYKLFDNS